MKLALLNTSIVTTTGTFKLEDISLDTARKFVVENEILSAIGHKSTADVMTTLLNINVIADRIEFAQETGQKALVFKLNGRPEEGKILTTQEIEQIGYKFQLLTKISD